MAGTTRPQMEYWCERRDFYNYLRTRYDPDMLLLALSQSHYLPNADFLLPRSIKQAAMAQKQEPASCSETSRCSISNHQQHSVVYSDSLKVWDDSNVKLQLVIEENKILKDTLHSNNVAIQMQLQTLTHRHDDVIKVHQKNLQYFEESMTKKKALMDEVNSLRNELLTVHQRNQELQRTTDQLKTVVATLRASASAAQSLMNELEVLRARNATLEQKVSELEDKKTAKQEELLAIIALIHRKLDTCEKSRVFMEKEMGKLMYQKRCLERKLLSMQSLETPLVYQTVDWQMDVNLWKMTNDFYVESAPTLTLCAGETIESLSFQLNEEKQHVAKARSLLEKHQDQLTKLVTATNKPCTCKASNKIESMGTNEVDETIEHLFQKVQNLQELLLSKEYEINHLKSRKTALEIDNDKLGILKSQVIVYRSDYLAERKSRESITSDRDRLLAELEMVKEENKLLSAQFPSAGGSGVTTQTGSRLAGADRRILAPSRSTNTAPASVISPGPSEPILECPNPDCKRQFDSLEPLQFHVHQCLQLSD